MGAAKERTDMGSFFTMGAEIIESDWHKGEIIVERRGLLHSRFTFLHSGKQIAELRWRHGRNARYDARGLRLDLEVRAMAKTICAKDEMSRLSHLRVKSPLNPRKAKMIIQLADSDGFIVHQRYHDAKRRAFSLHVTKMHYVTDLVEFKFDLRKKTRERIFARINVPAIMRWEAQHFHHLLALVMTRIAFVYEHEVYQSNEGRLPCERPLIGKRRWQST